MMVATLANIPSDICRAVIRIKTAKGDVVDVAASPDSVSSVTVANRILLHGISKRDSGPIGGFSGTDSLDEAGYLIVFTNIDQAPQCCLRMRTSITFQVELTFF